MIQPGWFGRRAPRSFIKHVRKYLDAHEPTPELNCLRQVVLSAWLEIVTPLPDSFLCARI